MPLHTLAKASQVGNNQQRSANARKTGRQRRPAKKAGNNSSKVGNKKIGKGRRFADKALA
jgi:hypothetical protein